MVFKVSISNEAKIDLESHYLHYREFVTKKVADQFFKSFIDAQNSLKKNPYHEIKFEDFRVSPLKKYPFIIIYFINSDFKTIIISRVFHTSKNPKKYPTKK